MRHCIISSIILSVIFFGHDGFGQSNDQVKLGGYFWSESVPMVESSLDGTTRGNMVLSIKGQKFKIVNIINDGVILRVLDYPSGSPNFQLYNFKGPIGVYNALSAQAKTSRNYGANQQFFFVEFDKVVLYAITDEKIRGSLAVGVINFPFKLRLQQGEEDFSGAFNFGAGIGYTLPHRSYSKYQYSFISGYSISSVNLDNSSTRRNQAQLESSNNFTAFSFSIGFLIQYEKAQAGIFVGWDQINRINQEQFGWKYQGKTWLSVGFGYSIFSNEKKSGSSDEVQ